MEAACYLHPQTITHPEHMDQVIVNLPIGRPTMPTLRQPHCIIMVLLRAAIVGPTDTRQLVAAVADHLIGDNVLAV